MKSIYHHREFLRFLRTQAFFNSSRMGSVRDARRMQGNHTSCYLFTAHKVAIHIIQYFVAIDIAMVVGNRNRQGMVVKKTRNKTTYDKVVAFKSNMNRRWLVYPSRDRFKIQDGENIGITATIPANDVKRMMGIMNSINNSLFLYAYKKISAFIPGARKDRGPYIPFTIGRMLKKLSVFADIFFWIPDRTERLHYKETIRRRIECYLINGSAGNMNIIAIGKTEFTIQG